MIPKPTAEYNRYPFDTSYTFTVDGGIGRYMSSPLDEVYEHEPGDQVAMGSLPPEEFEVRDHLLLACALRSRVSGFEFWWSQFLKPTEAYRKSAAAFERLGALAARSPEHRAAFVRLSRCSAVGKVIQLELTRMVNRADRSKTVVAA